MNERLARKRRHGSAQLILDASLGFSLLLALLLVLGFDRLRPTSAPQEARPVKVTQTSGEAPPSSGPASRTLNIGVTPAQPEYDDMGSLLHKLGEGYNYHGFPLEDLGNLAKISEYNTIFLTCSGVAEKWVKQRLGPADRPNAIQVIVDEKVMKQVSDNLRTFVGNGGTLYVSDRHFGLVEDAFPELVDRRKVGFGRVQTVTAEVVDPGLREVIGPRLSLQFDQPNWRPAAFAGENVVTYLQGSYQSSGGGQQTSPLLVKLRYKDGTVIFTSFHNEKVNSEVETKLLRYLVFTAVTAKVDAQVTNTMVQGGFSPAKKSIFGASKDQASLPQTYHCTKQGQLKFVLAFQSGGARLKLTVVGPDGQTYTEEGTSTVTVDVPQAIPGDWTYTVAALELPNENFAYTVTVGQK